MIGAAWPWVLAGVAVVIVLGLLFAVLVGVAGMPADFLRRLGQTAFAPRSERGRGLPEEVPTASAEETTRLVDDDRPS